MNEINRYCARGVLSSFLGSASPVIFPRLTRMACATPKEFFSLTACPLRSKELRVLGEILLSTTSSSGIHW